MKTPVITAVLLALTFAAMPVDAGAKRSQSAKVEFKQQHRCPATGAHKGPCKGYVIDHIKPLACGGADAPSNMQWQTVAEVRQRTSGSAKAAGSEMNIQDAQKVRKEPADI